MWESSEGWELVVVWLVVGATELLSNVQHSTRFVATGPLAMAITSLSLIQVASVLRQQCGEPFKALG